ncbi:MAG: hypothetical protein HY720_27465 [Planctomycetes bacterium]|nr:hypothetical protein [Planctomycetota bacterium]
MDGPPFFERLRDDRPADLVLGPLDPLPRLAPRRGEHHLPLFDEIDVPPLCSGQPYRPVQHALEKRFERALRAQDLAHLAKEIAGERLEVSGRSALSGGLDPAGRFVFLGVGIHGAIVTPSGKLRHAGESRDDRE